MLAASSLGTGPLLKLGNFPIGEDPVVGLCPDDEQGFLAVDFVEIGAERVFLYRLLRDFAKRLLCWNCDVPSSGDKLCGRGLIWPKSGAGGVGFGALALVGTANGMGKAGRVSTVSFATHWPMRARTPTLLELRASHDPFLGCHCGGKSYSTDRGRKKGGFRKEAGALRRERGLMRGEGKMMIVDLKGQRDITANLRKMRQFAGDPGWFAAEVEDCPDANFIRLDLIENRVRKAF